jgi:UDP-glucose 4-epimerase
MSNFVITGAQGFLGKKVVLKLLALKHEVWAIDLFPNGIPTEFIEATRELGGHLETIQLDICDKDELKRVPTPDYVIHLAAIANPRLCNANFDLAFNVNVGGLRNTLDAFGGCKKFIFASSVTVYGDQQYFPLKEDHPVNPRDNYSYLKLVGEYLCRMFNYSYGTPYLIIRLANSYGPGQGEDYLIPSLIRQALQNRVIELWDPRPIRDFIYVDDTVDAIVTVALSQNLVNDIVNIGSGKGTSTIELANLIAEITNAEVRDVHKRQDVPLRLVPDITKITSLTEWKPKVNLKSGLYKTITYLKRTMGA